MSQVFTSFAAQIEQEVDNSFAQSEGLLLIMDNIPIGDDYFVPQYRIDRQTSWPHLLPSSITEACDLPVDGELEQAFFYADLAKPKPASLFHLLDQFTSLSTLKVVTKEAKAKPLKLLTNLLVKLNEQAVPITSLQVIIEENLQFHWNIPQMPETDIAKRQKIVDEFIRLMNSVFTVSDEDEQEKDAVVVFPLFCTLVLCVGESFFERFRGRNLTQDRFTLLVSSTLQLPMLSQVEQAFLCLPLGALKVNLGFLRGNVYLQSVGMIS